MINRKLCWHFPEANIEANTQRSREQSNELCGFHYHGNLLISIERYLKIVEMVCGSLVAHLGEGEGLRKEGEVGRMEN